LLILKSIYIDAIIPFPLSPEDKRKGENLFLINPTSLQGKYDCITFLLIWHCHLLISFYSFLGTECKEIQKSVCEGEVFNRGVFT
jgi:hypothetical protein